MTQTTKIAHAKPAQPKKQASPRSAAARGSKGVLTLPDEATLKELARQLKLSKSQLHHLRLTLQHVHADLAAYQSDKVHANRAEIVRRLKLVEKDLARLASTFSRHAAYLGSFPQDFLAGAAGMLTFAAMNDALGDNLTPRQANTIVQQRMAAGDLFSVDEVETITLQYREMMGLKHGAELVPAIIARLHAPLKTWVELNRLNRGGRKTNLARLYLVTCLAKSAPEIIGRKAGQSQTGPFVRLCEAVLSACGIDAKGVEKVIERMIQPTPKKAKD